MPLTTGLGVGENGEAVGLSVELFSMYDKGQLTGEASLISYFGAEGCRVRSRGQATQ